MEKQRKFKTIGIAALIVAVLGLTIAFAALSSTLTINGTAKAESGLWQIKFVDDANIPTPTVSPVTTTGSQSDNTISVSQDGLTLTYSANLKTPGDKVTYTAVIKNYGTIDGQISTNGITNTLVTGDSDKAGRILDIKTYYVSDGKALEYGDVIKAGSEEEIKIVVTYNRDISSSDLPSTSESYVYEYTINYVQATTVAEANTHNSENVIEAPVQTYSFTLGDIENLSYTISDDSIFLSGADVTSFWSIVGADLTQIEDYRIAHTEDEETIYIFNIESDSNLIKGLSFMDMNAGYSNVNNSSYAIMINVFGDSIVLSILEPIYDGEEYSWNTYGLNSTTAADFLNTYSDVTFTFVPNE